MCLSDEGLVGREVEEGTEVGFGETEAGEVGLDEVGGGEGVGEKGVTEGENLRGRCGGRWGVCKSSLGG